MTRTIPALAIGLLGSVAVAQQATDSPSWATPAAQPAAPPTVGLPADSVIPDNPYEGVTPGTPNPPPRVAQIARAGRTLVTWPGFQMTSGGSRIFVETSAAVSFQETRGPNRFVVLLRNCKIHTRNNRNPLVTRHFNTPVRTAFLVPRRRDVELVVELRGEVSPSISQGDGPNGFRFLFIDFPGGAWLPGGEDSEIVPSFQSPSSSPESLEGAEEMPPEMQPETGGAGPTP